MDTKEFKVFGLKFKVAAAILKFKVFGLKFKVAAAI